MAVLDVAAAPAAHATRGHACDGSSSCRRAPAAPAELQCVSAMGKRAGWRNQSVSLDNERLALTSLATRVQAAAEAYLQPLNDSVAIARGCAWLGSNHRLPTPSWLRPVQTARGACARTPVSCTLSSAFHRKRVIRWNVAGQRYTRPPFFPINATVKAGTFGKCIAGTFHVVPTTTGTNWNYVESDCDLVSKRSSLNSRLTLTLTLTRGTQNRARLAAVLACLQRSATAFVTAFIARALSLGTGTACCTRSTAR